MNPSMMKIKKPILNNIQNGPGAKHIGSEDNEEMFEVVKHNLMAQKR